MSFEWLPILEEDLLKYKCNMQEAFQKGYEADYGKTTNIILPEADIEWSLTTNGAISYKAVVDGKIVGGAIVVIDEIAQHNHLDFLYVNYGTQIKGWCCIILVDNLFSGIKNIIKRKRRHQRCRKTEPMIWNIK